MTHFHKFETFGIGGVGAAIGCDCVAPYESSDSTGRGVHFFCVNPKLSTVMEDPGPFRDKGSHTIRSMGIRKSGEDEVVNEEEACDYSTEGEEEDADKHSAIVWGIRDALHEAKVSYKGFMG